MKPSIDQQAAVYRRKDRVVTRKVVDETLLVPIRGDVDQMQHFFAMNSVAAHVWNGIDGSNTLSDLVDSVCSAFEVDRPQAQRDVRDFIDQLLEADIIECA